MFAAASERMVIVGAIKEIELKTCIRFKRRTTETAYVNIFKGNSGGCTSYVGMITHPAFQPQKLNLERNCVTHGVVAHELIHAIGFEHGEFLADL